MLKKDIIPLTDEENEDTNRQHNDQYVENFSELPTHMLDKLKMADNYHKRSYAKMYLFFKTKFIDPNYTCTVFRISNEDSVNYAYLYSVNKTHINKYEFYTFDDDPVLIHYLIAPSLTSQDGEYRQNFLKFNQFENVVKLYPDIFDKIVKIINEKVIGNVSYKHYNLNVNEEKLNKKIEEMQLTMKFLCIFWINEIYKISINLQENHVNPKFNKVFFPHLADDLSNLKKISKDKNLNKFILTTSIPTAMINEKTVIMYQSIGQKIIPLSLHEYYNRNILCKTWRELELTLYTNNLVMNYICPSFPILIGKSFLTNVDEELFDNEQQILKMHYSNIANSLLQNLEDAKKATIDDVFKTVHEMLEEPIIYTKENIAMSSTALILFCENVGKTFYDAPSMEKSKKWMSQVGSLYGPFFPKYIWDICYALLSMNVKLSMTHGDLHLNNATINNNVKEFNKEKKYVLYSIGTLRFCFETMGPYSYLIDFSRSTIHPDKIDKELQAEFISEQNKRIIHSLETHFPSFMMVNNASMNKLIINQFDKFYKIFTAVDIFNFSSKLLKYMNKNDLLDKIKKTSEDFIIHNFTNLIKNPEINIDWPMIHIMKECFSSFVVNINEVENLNIIDVWDLNREMKYDIKDFTKWNPIFTDTKGKNSNGKIYNIPKLEIFNKYYLNSLKVFKH